MRTQQQALTELCKNFRPCIRRAFLFEWLKEIDWLKEADLLLDGFSNEHAELIGHLQKFHIAKNEYFYPTERFGYMKDSLKLDEYIKILQDVRQKNESFFINGTFISPKVMAEYDIAIQSSKVFALLFDYGIDKEEFQGHTNGQALVDELETIINNQDLE